MATQRPMGKGTQLRSYAGIDPATGRKHYLYDQVPADVGKRELDRRIKALDAAAQQLLDSRRERRRDPAAPARRAPKPRQTKTVGDAVEAWWTHHGSKLAAASKRRPLIDGIILPHLGDVKLELLAGTPPDDPDDRDPDIVYLSERWEEIRLTGRKAVEADGTKRPLKPSVIQTCHTSILAPALRRAGHPIADPGLPRKEPAEESTPLPEEMAAFLPHLGTGRAVESYTVTRRIRGTDKTTSYTVPARQAETSAMDRMLEAFAFLVANGPRPVEAAAITRAQINLDTGALELTGAGVIESEDGLDRWVVVTGESTKRRRRRITLDTRCLAALRRWLAFQDEYALALGARLGPRALVFSLDPAGKAPVSPKVMSKAFERTVDTARDAGASLPERFHLYSMRHYGITQALRNGNGRNVAAVAHRFGTSTRMIEERYEHAIPKDDAHIAEAIGSAWGDESVPGGDVVPFAVSTRGRPDNGHRFGV